MGRIEAKVTDKRSEMIIHSINIFFPTTILAQFLFLTS
jgi:hypothetical protein